MDFFEAQAAAHRTTLRLVGLFIGAILALVTLTVLLVAAAIAYNMPPAGLVTFDKIFTALSPQLILGIGGTVVGVVGVASVFRHLSLSGGGRSIAESLGGRRLAPNSSDPDERRLLNVVEEMSIAAGVPVPAVYVLEEAGINAFAAGYSPDDAVIGVTRGTLELLDRAELQGVIGHEFSHILNGDMRLNIRLMSILFGILVIGVVGRSLLLSRPRGRMAGGGNSRRGGGTAQVAVLGIGLMILGYIGTVFGNLIKAAVSRQREFLADASSVQFTRNPDGIAGALKKIGAASGHSRIEDGRADEMSHMFFGPVNGAISTPTMFAGLSTHPPLPDRIRAVDPRWDGKYPKLRPAAPRSETPPKSTGARRRPTDAEMEDKFASALDIRESPLTGGAGAVLGGILATAATSRVGQVRPSDVDEAHALIEGIPAPLFDAAHDPFGARALIYSLLLAVEAPVHAEQRKLIGERAEPGVPELLDALLAALPRLPLGSRLPLVQLAMPALKELSDGQYRRFLDTLVALIRSDGSIAPFEWVLHQVLLKELGPHFDGVRRRPRGNRSLVSLAGPAATLLSTVARTGQEDLEAARTAFAAAAGGVELDPESFEAADDPDMTRLSEAMRALRMLHPLQQPRLLKACIRCVLHNDRVLDRERDLLHGVAAALDCPLPPLVADDPPS